MAATKKTIVTKEIDEFIDKHYETTRAKVIAEKFGLKTKHVQNRAHQLGIKKWGIK